MRIWLFIQNNEISRGWRKTSQSPLRKTSHASAKYGGWGYWIYHTPPSSAQLRHLSCEAKWRNLVKFWYFIPNSENSRGVSWIPSRKWGVWVFKYTVPPHPLRNYDTPRNHFFWDSNTSFKIKEIREVGRWWSAESGGYGYFEIPTPPILCAIPKCFPRELNEKHLGFEESIQNNKNSCGWVVKQRVGGMGISKYPSPTPSAITGWIPKSCEKKISRNSNNLQKSWISSHAVMSNYQYGLVCIRHSMPQNTQSINNYYLIFLASIYV